MCHSTRSGGPLWESVWCQGRASTSQQVKGNKGHEAVLQLTTKCCVQRPPCCMVVAVGWLATHCGSPCWSKIFGTESRLLFGPSV